jgi:uncharacterized HAD superfamily protein
MDGTICSEEKTYSRCLAKPKKGAIKVINTLFEAGNTIIIYTARSWFEYEMTVDWLKKYEIKYHQLFMGKPIGDIWIDDRAVPFKDNWNEIAQKIMK